LKIEREGVLQRVFVAGIYGLKVVDYGGVK
jgi:hypothetical protein